MNNSKWTRRDFLGTTAVLGAALPMMGLNGMAASAESVESKSYKTKLYKACGVQMGSAKATIEKAAKEGYQGLEMWDWNVDIVKAREIRAIAEANGVRIHSVVRAWTNFNQPAGVKADIESVKKALQTAHAYGADTILLVPCRISERGVLPADKFKIDFDPNTCMVKSIVDGDNSSYKKYIELHNEATKISRQCVEETIATAAYEGVTIALENVWNNLWVCPKLAAAFVKMFDNHWVKAYLDLGNNCKYAPTEDWLRALGKENIAKLHIKDFRINPEKPNGGDFVPIGYGSINWVSVRNVIEEIGYNGWITTEDVNHYSLGEHVQILDKFFAGNLTQAEATKIKPFKQ